MSSLGVSGLQFAALVLVSCPLAVIRSSGQVATAIDSNTGSKRLVVHDSWSNGAPMPKPVKAPAAGAINGRIYVAGGLTTNERLTAVNQIYTPATNRWTVGVPIPIPVSAPASSVVNGTLYVIGGYTRSSNPTNLVQGYDPVANAWTTKSPMPTSRG